MIHAAAREKLAIEVQAEALRPTPGVNANKSLQERLDDALRRVRELDTKLAELQQQHRYNQSEYKREVARQRKELGLI